MLVGRGAVFDGGAVGIGGGRLILACQNVSTVGYPYTGTYTVNFTNPMPHAQYAVAVSCTGFAIDIQVVEATASYCKVLCRFFSF